MSHVTQTSSPKLKKGFLGSDGLGIKLQIFDIVEKSGLSDKQNLSIMGGFNFSKSQLLVRGQELWGTWDIQEE